MVLSRIYPALTYTENKRIEEADKEKGTFDLYEVTLRHAVVNIAIGQAKHPAGYPDLVYYPLYLEKPNGRVVQFAVHECRRREQLPVTEEEEKRVVRTLEPLYYSFATSTFLRNRGVMPEPVSAASSSAAAAPLAAAVKRSHAIRLAHLFTRNDNVLLLPVLHEETRKQAKDQRAKYHELAQDAWVAKFFRNGHYRLQDNQGGNDSLFACVRDAFAEIGLQTTLAALRQALAEAVTDETVVYYKTAYDSYRALWQKQSQEIKDLAAKYQQVRTDIANPLVGRAEQQRMAQEALRIKEEHDALIGEKRVTAQLWKPLTFLKQVRTADDLKRVILSPSYAGGDAWSLCTLERLLHIKCILLSWDAYTAKPRDSDHVLQCGHTCPLEAGAEVEAKAEAKADAKAEAKADAEAGADPDFYIVLQVSGGGTVFQLVSYKRKTMFLFSELPYDLRRQMVDRCGEGTAGDMARVTALQTFRQSLSRKKTTDTDTETESTDAVDAVDGTLTRTPADDPELFSDDIVFCYYEKSSTKPLPGRGPGERIRDPTRIRDFSRLANLRDWRRKLSDAWLQPFQLDNRTWMSVVHFMQAQKFRKFPAFYDAFATQGRETDTALSQQVELARAAGSPSGVRRVGTVEERVRPENVEPDLDTYELHYARWKREALEAKFEQNPDLLDVLLATYPAVLAVYKKGRPAVPNRTLMELRAKLRKNPPVMTPVPGGMHLMTGRMNTLPPPGTLLFRS